MSVYHSIHPRGACVNTCFFFLTLQDSDSAEYAGESGEGEDSSFEGEGEGEGEGEYEYVYETESEVGDSGSEIEDTEEAATGDESGPEGKSEMKIENKTAGEVDAKVGVEARGEEVSGDENGVVSPAESSLSDWDVGNSEV